MNDSINNEGSESAPMGPEEAPTEPHTPAVTERATVEQAATPAVANEYAPAYAPVYAAEPTVAPKHGVTISRRALWIGGAVALAVLLLAGSFGVGAAVGRHTGGGFDRVRGGMMRQAPNSGGDGWRNQCPRGYGDGSGEYGNRNDGRGWGGQGRGGQGYRGIPRSQFPTGTPSP